MPSYQFEREARTPQSEAYAVIKDGREIGRIDIHYTSDLVSATLCAPEDTSENDLQELIGEIDDRLVMTTEPFREDFVVTVWLGRQAGVFSEEFDEEIDEDVEGNGHLE
jgi:hypothetical protein